MTTATILDTDDEVTKMAKGCYNGACNLMPMAKALGVARDTMKREEFDSSLEVKMIVGQMAYLQGIALGPSDETLRKFKEKYEILG